MTILVSRIIFTTTRRGHDGAGIGSDMAPLDTSLPTNIKYGTALINSISWSTTAAAATAIAR